MFSGPGISAFFQPLRAAGSEASPTQAIAATRKAGDEQKRHSFLADENAETETAAGNIPPEQAGDTFTEDHTTLSLEALRRLLAHTPATEPPETEQTAQGDADTRGALAAYHRAEDTKPVATTMPGMDSFVPPAQDRATAQDILMILAKLESAGIHEIAVRDGASVYDTISALCWSLSRPQ